MADTKGREFEIAAIVAELLDSLNKEQQRQVMAMLASRYGGAFVSPAPTRASSHQYRRRAKQNV